VYAKGCPGLWDHCKKNKQTKINENFSGLREELIKLKEVGLEKTENKLYPKSFKNSDEAQQ
jgi:hypothetical protein